jgi:hypothetical protein
MGTRHLIAVMIDGEYKIAQYGQWDGYPSGQGADILSFLGSMDRERFEAKVRATRLMTRDELEKLSASIEREFGTSGGWQKKYPHLSRDAGAEILSIVNNSEAGLRLKNSIDFAGDSLFCEWTYVIDLDKNTLEVYRGLNKEPLGPGERFASAKQDNAEYTPIRLAASYSLVDLPSVEKMEADVRTPEEQEEESQ